MDSGIATINQACRIQSVPIIDSQFWTFSISTAPRADTMPLLNTINTGTPEQTSTTNMILTITTISENNRVTTAVTKPTLATTTILKKRQFAPQSLLR